jgi:hypothetical protein
MNSKEEKCVDASRPVRYLPYARKSTGGLAPRLQLQRQHGVAYPSEQFVSDSESDEEEGVGARRFDNLGPEEQ